MRLFRDFIISAILTTVGEFQLVASDPLAVLPPVVKLTGPEARQTLLIERSDGLLATEFVRSGTWSSSDERIAKVVEGQVIPVGNGSAMVSVSINGETASTTVIVENFDEAHQWSFRNHVQSIMSKAGCNSGACHGAAAGKNGFKLSLRGYDPEHDFFSITHHARGRRVVPDDPGRSLILTKPTCAIPHQGGFRFGEDSYEYRVVAEWIAQGLQPPSERDPRIQKLEILPRGIRVKSGSEQPMIVIAEFSDGHSEDVTRWAKYTSTNHSVCTVDDRGMVTVSGSGEGAIVAWYLAQNTTATITVPYPQTVDAELFAGAHRANFIDDLVLEKLHSLNLPPSPRSDDSEFIRRVFLDTIGVLPTVDEVQAFLADTSEGKRGTDRTAPLAAGIR